MRAGDMAALFDASEIDEAAASPFPQCFYPSMRHRRLSMRRQRLTMRQWRYAMPYEVDAM